MCGGQEIGADVASTAAKDKPRDAPARAGTSALSHPALHFITALGDSIKYT